MDQPQQLAALNPLPTTIVESRRLPNGGWFGRMLVDDSKGSTELMSESVEYAPPTRVVSRSMIRGRHPVTTVKTLSAIEGGTRVRVELHYRVPVSLPLVDKLYERRWQRIGQSALDSMLQRWAASFAQ
jgi:hypothetical protein